MSRPITCSSDPRAAATSMRTWLRCVPGVTCSGCTAGGSARRVVLGRSAGSWARPGARVCGWKAGGGSGLNLDRRELEPRAGCFELGRQDLAPGLHQAALGVEHAFEGVAAGAVVFFCLGEHELGGGQELSAELELFGGRLEAGARGALFGTEPAL